MKIYQEAFVDGMYTVPDLKLDWDSLLSDKYNLWAKYKCALLKFYYSPNHEGACSDVAREFNDKASSLNALIMNFGRVPDQEKSWDSEYYLSFFMFKMLASCLIIFTICIGIDWCRKKIFELVGINRTVRMISEKIESVIKRAVVSFASS